VVLEKLSIALEVTSFFLVAPEFLGAARLHSIARGSEGWMSGPLAKLEGFKRNIEKKKDFYIGHGLWQFYAVLCSISGVLIGSAVVFYRKFPNFTSLVVLWVVLSVAGVLVFLFLQNMILITLPYIVAMSLKRLLSGALHFLAAEDRLRLWIFWSGAMLFVTSKLVAWLAVGD